MRRLKLLSYCIVSTMFVACSEDLANIDHPDEAVNEEIEEDQSDDELGYAPNMRASPWFDWEDTSVQLGVNGNTQTAILPWASGSSTNAPFFMYNDYKKEDGWELLYNYTGQVADAGRDYLFFYNKFTGIFRVWYYLSSTVGSGSGIWGFHLQDNSGLFNNSGYFALPANMRDFDEIVVTNISTINSTKAITSGWNVFDVEITYDPQVSNQFLRLGVKSYDQNIQDVNIYGTTLSQSEGEIYNHSSGSGLLSTFLTSAAKASGGTAEGWLKSKLEPQGNNDNDKPFKLIGSLIPGIVSGGVTEIVNAGLNLILGSFIGKSGSTAQQIKFTTKGETELTGTITSNSPNNAKPIANVYFPGSKDQDVEDYPHYHNDQLGVWNLASAPIIYVPEKLNYAGENHLGQKLYGRRPYLGASSIDLLFNEDLLSEIDNYQVTSQIFYYHKFQGINDLIARPANSFYGRMYVDGVLVYEDADNEAHKYPHEYIAHHGYFGTPDFLLEQNYNKNYVVKVQVKIFPNSDYNQEPVIISRTYLPTFQLVP